MTKNFIGRVTNRPTPPLSSRQAEAESLPENLADLSNAGKNKVARVIEELERGLRELNSDSGVSEAERVLLLHDSQMVLTAIGRGLPAPER